MKVKATVVMTQSKTAEVEVGLLVYDATDTASAARVTTAKNILRHAIMAAQQVFPSAQCPSITVRTKTSGIE